MKLKHLVSVPLYLALAGSLLAQDRLIPKQLAGPIEELQTGVMAKSDPIATAVHSKSSMVPVQLVLDKDGAWKWQGVVAAEGVNLRLVLFSGEESWDLSLTEPGGKSPVPARALAGSLERSSLDLGGASFAGDQYQFQAMAPGNWKVSVAASAPANDRGYLLVSSDGPYRLLSFKTADEQLVGHQIGFATYGYEQLAEQTTADIHIGLVETATLRVTTPAGEVQQWTMRDDGLHGDGKAGDGMFGASFVPRLEGDYLAQVTARGTTPQGHPFVRSAQHIVPVITRRLELMHDFVTGRVQGESRLMIDLRIENSLYAPEKYRVFAEVWGADALGEMKAVSWIGGMSYVDNGRLSLGLDLRWIGRSPAQNSFELRNLRIEDPDHFITVARVERLPIVMPTLPAAAQETVKSVDETMLMGHRPTAAANKAGSRLLLVHGYCSGNVWGPVAGQFTNASIFLDTNKNRSHDQFANLIGSFGSSYSSYGIVAHSQGGAAALHLYTYYWSGLDYASAGRLIQSVGTPYQGTPLAGNAAVLGQIFGIGCGANTDLTYSGAASWLSGVPTWARNQVNYFTTSFTDKWWRYDYCHLISDLLLSDPDDGTTEKAKGQLASGINRGHKTGWCHTDGMRDPNQTRDSGRNGSMNSNAAR